jgi:hypothetical protein
MVELAMTHFYNAVIITLLLIMTWTLRAELRYVAWEARDIHSNWPAEIKGLP